MRDIGSLLALQRIETFRQMIDSLICHSLVRFFACVCFDVRLCQSTFIAYQIALSAGYPHFHLTSACARENLIDRFTFCDCV
ncbi:hypothetical protein NY2A_b664L [Paramecium bursaria Chlorella virus NY2A]|uniref:Uncharacterized protein b664L n=1 Tax=Paramecium bursaria Chlorella virus NY2A TaxID=46021 RepID=A7IXI9_PBCVN|nr:hypothetical protein NY2A_b664L [Paramecium bursaria Chlorella virus NY2A]ABT15063.1 hypothetical protein NY2A_b664L [Paramecium bursaria Chlorella virus NY2A]